MYLTEIIKELPSDTQEKVKDAKAKYNLLIREAIRQETRFRLMATQENVAAEGKVLNQKISISTEIGYPKELKDYQIPEEHKISSRLAMIRPDILKLIGSSDVVSGFLGRHKIPGFSDSNHECATICYAQDIARELLKRIETFDLIRELLSIHKDMLGAYFFQVPKNKHPFYEVEDSSINARIELYWGVIGLAAANLGVNVQSLTAVVIAHELAHAYTHLGCDIEGHRWNDEQFHFTELAVVEGLAQYYTENVSQKLDGRIPGMYEAYKALLEKQGGPYLQHKIWIDKMNITPEVMRTSLINFRKSPFDSLLNFEQFLSETQSFTRRR